MPAWPDRTIWWHLHPVSFTGAEAEARPEARLTRIEAWLDYLAELNHAEPEVAAYVTRGRLVWPDAAASER